MSESNMFESWEHGLGQEPPVLVASLMRHDEHLLWAARLKSIATATSHFHGAIFSLIGAGFFLAIAPWGESLLQYCGPDTGRGRCTLFFYATWPAILLQTAIALKLLWSGWKAGHRPWVIGYALSTQRALLINETRPKDFRYIYLRLHPPKLEPSGILGFEGEAQSFVGLDHQLTARALYSATDGRRTFLKDQITATP
jgi:hypothetical protein